MRIRPLGLLALAALGGCAPARAAAPRASLHPDSLALLDRAIESVRPAYPTQAEAIRAGVYQARPAVPAVLGEPSTAAPPPALPPRPEPRVPTRSEPVPPSPPPAPAPSGIPAPARERAWVVQIAAYRDEASARAAADDALRTFPALVPVVEVADGWFRVALEGWADESGARAALPGIRRIYSSAWIRPRSVP